ncbi:hypothetical protein ACFL3H_07130 [Gemmatimonadota bacterium]
MSLGDRFRRMFRRRQDDRSGLDTLDRDDIRNIVEESLEETEATSEIVERARDAHERARDLVRQGHLEAARDRFSESITAWEEQADLCREMGFRNMWKDRPASIRREMEELRIAHLDIIDLDSFTSLHARARLRRTRLFRILEMVADDAGSSESEVYEEFPRDQHEDVSTILFHAQRRGWITRERTGSRYRLRITDSAPAREEEPGDPS